MNGLGQHEVQMGGTPIEATIQEYAMSEILKQVDMFCSLPRLDVVRDAEIDISFPVGLDFHHLAAA